MRGSEPTHQQLHGVSNPELITALSNEDVKMCTQIEHSESGRKLLVDSGASKHMIRDRDLFSEYSELPHAVKVTLGNGSTVDAIGRGQVTLTTSTKCGVRMCVMSDALHVLDLNCNMLSISVVTNHGHIVSFCNKKCTLKRSDGVVLGIAPRYGNLYVFDCTVSSSHSDRYKVDTKRQTVQHMTDTGAQQTKQCRVQNPTALEPAVPEWCVPGSDSREETERTEQMMGSESQSSTLWHQ